MKRKKVETLFTSGGPSGRKQYFDSFLTYKYGEISLHSVRLVAQIELLVNTRKASMYT